MAKSQVSMYVLFVRHLATLSPSGIIAPGKDGIKKNNYQR